MEARLVREELEKCLKGEGVNHYENCKWLSDKYLKMMKENRVSWVVVYMEFHLCRWDLSFSTTQVQGYKQIEL